VISKSAQSALTGRWAISRDPYIVLSFSTIISVVLTDARTFELTEILGWLIASAGGYAIFCLVLLLAHKTLFKNRTSKPLPIWWIFALGASAGVIKGVTTAVFSFALNLDNSLAEAIISRAFAAGLIGLAGVPGVALVMHSLDIFRQKRADLIAEQILIESKEVQNQEVISVMSAQLRNSIENDLELLTVKLRNSLDEKADLVSSWQMIADDLRAAATESVRSISHRLWDREARHVNEINIIDIGRAMITTSAFPLKYILPVLFISATPQTINDYGIPQLGTRLLVLGLTTAIIYSLAEFMIYKWQRLKLPIYFSALVVAAVSPSIIGALILDDEINAHFIGISVTMAIWLPVLTITCGLIDTALKQRQEILDELQSEINQSRVRSISENNETIRISNDMAKYLHGNLQSRLMASALAIETAGRLSDAEALTTEIEKARKSISTPFDQFVSSGTGSLLIQMNQLIATWNGILKTNLSFSGIEGDLSPTQIRNILHIVEESFANALRHGLATEISLDIEFMHSKLNLLLIDNGLGPRGGIPGLGSSLFTSIAGSDWSLSRGPDGVGSQLKLGLTSSN
jgi:signal transduction histidine kinase